MAPWVGRRCCGVYKYLVSVAVGARARNSPRAAPILVGGGRAPGCPQPPDFTPFRNFHIAQSEIEAVIYDPILRESNSESPEKQREPRAVAGRPGSEKGSRWGSPATAGRRASRYLVAELLGAIYVCAANRALEEQSPRC